MICKYNDTISIKHGINAALISEYLWKEVKNNGTCFENRNWIRCGQKRIMGVFPFLGECATRTALRKLLKSGIIIRTEHNKSKFDRTYSYSFTNYGRAIMRGENLAEKTDEIIN